MNKNISSFEISNQSEWPMLIIHEPEGFEFRLPPNEEVTIVVQSSENSIQLRWWVEGGGPGVNIMPGESNFKVFYKGKDVFKEFLE